jgi:nitrogen fixation/metabolism regulation signal transduction histidine kinase
MRRSSRAQALLRSAAGDHQYRLPAAHLRPYRRSIANESMTPRGRQNRQLKNYLLDSRFQLKYSAYLAGIALLLSLGLGFLLWRTSNAVLAQSHQTVAQGNQVVQRGSEVLKESQKVSDVVKMSIVKDPVYSDNPELLEVFKGDSDKQAERLNQQQRTLEGQAAELKQRSNDIANQQKVMLWTLTTALTLLVVLIGLAGIVVTHKVAGPIYKMKRQIKEVGDGKLRIPAPLRKGDDLVDFFEAFERMVVNLRDRQQKEIDRLESALATLETKVAPNELQAMHELLRDMKAALDV